MRRAPSPKLHPSALVEGNQPPFGVDHQNLTDGDEGHEKERNQWYTIESTKQVFFKLLESNYSNCSPFDKTRSRILLVLFVRTCHC
jgi:hypothetical protein